MTFDRYYIFDASTIITDTHYVKTTRPRNLSILLALGLNPQSSVSPYFTTYSVSSPMQQTLTAGLKTENTRVTKHKVTTRLRVGLSIAAVFGFLVLDVQKNCVTRTD